MKYSINILYLGWKHATKLIQLPGGRGRTYRYIEFHLNIIL